MAYSFVKIRSATKNDLKACERLLRVATMKCATGEYYSRSFLKEYLDKNFFLVAEKDEAIIGCIFGEKIKGKGAMIWALTVSNKQRGLGVGGKLLKTFETNCRNVGIKWCILYAPQKNNKTCNFYKKHKFNKGIICIEFVKGLRKSKK